MRWMASTWKYANAAVVAIVCVYYLIVPPLLIISYASDPALKTDAIPRFAVRLHRSLSPRYERWARARVAARAGAEVSVHDISGTEWPVFGSAFYLWATEELQRAWDDGELSGKRPPREYARGAIEAATALVLDPAHAAWVRTHWGDDYLRRENVFYRMLVIAAITSHERLLGTGEYLPVLREQVETLAAELDASRFGLLDDYPGQCYPGDVLAAVAMIRRADSVLATDHSAFAARAVRGFAAPLIDSSVYLPPYFVYLDIEPRVDISRGCANSYLLLFAPELWPDTAQRWYARYEKHFWQSDRLMAGFREFPRGYPGSDWYADVDAGPVIGGLGVSAGAFGIGAARANGRFDHASVLSAEVLASSWPLLDGTLLGPRMLSDATDAPLLGEAGLLFSYTRRAVAPTHTAPDRGLPFFYHAWLLLYFGAGMLGFAYAAVRLRFVRRWVPSHHWHCPVLFGVWTILLLGGVGLLLAHLFVPALLLLVFSQLVPVCRPAAAS